MDEVMWIRLINEGVSLFLLIGLAFALYRGVRRNQKLLSEREELLKRYLLFRGSRQAHLNIFGEDDDLYRELLKNLSNSWKTFKKAYDQCILSLAQNTTTTKRSLQLITLGLLINSGRLLAEEFFFFGLKGRLFHIVARELTNYVPVILSFFLLKNQTHPFLPLKGEAVKVDRDMFFFPNHRIPEGEREVLNNEFDPLEAKGGEDGKEDQNPHW